MINILKLKLIKTYIFIAAFTPLEAFLAPVIVVFYLKYIGISFIQYSNYIALLLILNSLLEVPMGVVSDLIGRKKALIIGNFIYFISMGVILYTPNIYTLYITAISFSIGSTLSSGNLGSIAYEIFSDNKIEDKYGIFFSKVGSISIGVSALAALAGGYLADIDISYPMIVDTLILGSKVLIGILIFVVFWPRNIDNNEKNSEQNNRESNTHKNKINLNIILSDFKKAKDVILKKDYLLSLILGAACFSLLRTSLNFYQPALVSTGVSETELGYLFSFGILISSLISFLCTHYNLIKMEIKFGYYFMVVMSLSSSLLFLYDNGIHFLFFLGFIFHQIIRVIIPSIESHNIQFSIPRNYKYRTSVISFSFLFKAIVTAIFISITGYITSKDISYTNTLVFLHVSIIVALVLSLFFLRNIKEKKSMEAL
ncbi:MFS transporter [Vibrio salinus]|uniref:MFS transporter n=1 Tax=Vibrio salinus TaxID=2899784 RepID=UPI001E39C4EA|nr:MFS transporter [Vibrio salinus]MCE0493776.1 MFS transporter [Vibrio salinus]